MNASETAMPVVQLTARRSYPCTESETAIPCMQPLPTLLMTNQTDLRRHEKETDESTVPHLLVSIFEATQKRPGESLHLFDVLAQRVIEEHLAQPGKVRRFIEATADTGLLQLSKQVHELAEQRELPASSTKRLDVGEEMISQIETLFEAAREIHFEDGMENDFSGELIRLVRQHSNLTIDTLAHLVITEKVNARVASEALRWLGCMDDPDTYRARLWLLERSLYCSSARVRDGAALGIAFMDDPRAAEHLREAIKREPVAELKRDLEQVLKQLESR